MARSPSPSPTRGSSPLVRGMRLLFLLAVASSILYLMISPRVAEHFLFLPGRSDPGPSPRVAEVQGEDLTLQAGDGVALHAWWFEADPEAPAVLFFHGNAGTIGDRLFQADGMLREGVSILLLSYRGYGRSGGRPSERGLALDAEAGLRWVAERTGGPGRVVVHGRSLGGAVAGGLVAEHPEVAGLILESTFTDLEAMAASVYPFLPRFLLRRLRGHFDTRTALARVQSPILVIHGTRDEIVPFSMGTELRDAAPGDPHFLEVPGARHNDLPWVAGTDYFRQVATFVEEAVSSRP
jgi:uncharacterized protein